MNYQDLRNALPIRGGLVTIEPTLAPSVSALLTTCYGNQPVVIDQAVPGPGDGQNDTVVIAGRASFLNVADLPVVATFTLDGQGAVQATLRYTLLGENPGLDAWKFSRSFPDLPVISGVLPAFYTRPQSPLDSLNLINTDLVVTTYAHQEGADLKTGINLVGELKPNGILGMLESTLGAATSVPIHGTIQLPQPVAVTLPLKLGQFPWSDGVNAPGIRLKADLGQIAIGSATFDAYWRIYSPTTAAWMDANDTFEIVQAYTGTLNIPSAQITADLAALISPDAASVLLRGDYTGIKLGKLADLVDISGSSDLMSHLPDEIKNLGDQIGKLELMTTAIFLTRDGGKISVVGTYFTVGMPELNWKIWSDHFKVNSVACAFAVRKPFSSPAFAVRVLGTVEIEGVPVNLFAASDEGFTVYAELAEQQTIPLRQLMQTYVPGIPAPSDLTIDTMNVQIAPMKYYAMSMTMAGQPNPWVIDVGVMNLTVSDLIFMFTYPQGGPASGSFGGRVAFGDYAMLDLRYDLPADFAIRGTFPTISLTELIGQVLGTLDLPMPEGFDLSFVNSSVLIQKQGESYTLLFGTELQNFGLFAMQVCKTSGTDWGFAAGLDLTQGLASNLPDLAPVRFFEDFFHLQKLMLVISTMDNVGFTFPDMAKFNNPQIAGGRLSLPGRGGVIAGFNFFGQWVINTADKQQNLLKDLLGLDPTLGITLQIGKDPSQDARLYISYDTKIEGMPLSCKFGGQLSAGSIGLFLEGAMGVEIQGQKQTFDVKLDFVENGAFISTTMAGNTPVRISIEDVEVFKIGNLALAIGCNWEGIPSLGVAGTISMAKFASSLAVFFDSAEPQKSLVAGSLSDLSLKDILDTLTGDAIPSEIDGVLANVAIEGTRPFEIPGTLADDLDQLNIAKLAAAFAAKGVTVPSSLEQVFFIVAEKGSRWFLTDQKNRMLHYELEKQGDTILVKLDAQLYCAPQKTQIGSLPPYEMGFFVNGGLNLFGLKASATITVNPNQGIAVDAEMNKIVIGSEKFFSIKAAKGDGGPQISAATFTQPSLPDEKFRPPHFYINGELNLLGLSRITYAALTTSGVEFELKGDMTPFLNLDLHGHLKGLTDMGIGGAIHIGLGTIDLGPLGKIDINTGVKGTLDIAVAGDKISASVSGGFEFAGQSFDVGFNLDVTTDALLNVAETALDAVKQILLDFLKDAARWAKLVAEKVITGVEDMVKVLQDYFDKTLAEAQQIADEAWGVVKQACAVTTAALNL